MTNSEIQRLSAPVVQAYLDMEDELLRLIGEQLGRDKRLSDTSKWRIRQLARAGEVNRQALAIIDSYAGGISAEVAEAVLAAAEGEVGVLDEAMLSLLSEKGKMTDEQMQMMQAFERQSRQDLNIENASIAHGYAEALEEDCNLVNTVMGYQTQSTFVSAVNQIYNEAERQRVLDEMNAGAMSVVSGNESLQEATRKTIKRIAEKGIPGFVDKAGREWSPEAYVKMDLRSTMGNTARAAQDARCDRYGISLIEVSSHMGARPKCAPYQGRIFSRDGTRGVTEDINGRQIEYIPLSETSYGEPDGLFGINCGHQQYPFIPGVSLQRYYPYDEEQNAERYREFQHQRAMERKIRSDKQECMMLQAAGDEEGLKEAAKKLRLDKEKYKDFNKAHGLGDHMENTQVYGYDKSKSMKTVWAGRTNGSGNSGSAANSTNTGTVSVAPDSSSTQTGTTNMVSPNMAQQKIGGIMGNSAGNALTGNNESGIIRDNIIDINVKTDGYQKRYHYFTVDEIEDELLNSEVGRHTIEIIKNKALLVVIDYDNDYLTDSELGAYSGGIVVLNMRNIYTKKALAKALIHEVTHAEIDSEVNTLKEEVYCKIQEFRHDKEPTYSDVRQIVRDVNSLYREKGLRWKDDKGFRGTFSFGAPNG